MVIVRVKYLYDILCQVLLLNCLLIITLIKRIQVKGIDRLCIPNTKCIYNVVSITYNWQIIRYGTNRLISCLSKMLSSCLVLCYCYVAAKLNLTSVLSTANLKWITIS